MASTDIVDILRDVTGSKDNPAPVDETNGIYHDIARQGFDLNASGDIASGINTDAPRLGDGGMYGAIVEVYDSTETIREHSADIVVVSDNIDSVITNADNITDINAVAENMGAILDVVEVITTLDADAQTIPWSPEAIASATLIDNVVHFGIPQGAPGENAPILDFQGQLTLNEILALDPALHASESYQSTTAGEIPDPPGGASIEATTVAVFDVLFSNGSEWFNGGSIRGEKGEAGINGIDGASGAMSKIIGSDTYDNIILKTSTPITNIWLLSEDPVDPAHGVRGDGMQPIMSNPVDGSQWANLGMMVGDDGLEAVVTVESTITGLPGTDAIVEDMNTTEDNVADLRFTIPAGLPAEVTVRPEVITGAAGTYASVQDFDTTGGDNVVDLQFTVPRGDIGPSATVAVSPTSITGDAGTDVSVQDLDAANPNNSVFQFTIPKGDIGDTGLQGIQGMQGVGGTTTINSTSTLNEGMDATVTPAVGSTPENLILDFGIPKGDTGNTGDIGLTGVQGLSGTTSVNSTTTLPAGTDATVVETVGSTPENVSLDFGIPQGIQGDKGEAGDVSVNSTVTLASGSDATVTEAAGSTPEHTLLDFGIPVGDTGPQGEQGEVSVRPVVIQVPFGGNAGVVDYDGSLYVADLEFTIPLGEKGDTGTSTSVAVNPVVGVLAPGSSATVETTFDPADPSNPDAIYLNFKVPQGVVGDTGATSTVTVDNTVNQVAFGVPPSVIDLDAANPHNLDLQFTLPVGKQGFTGDSASASVYAYKQVPFGDPLIISTIVDVDDANHLQLSFEIPEGEVGAKGKVQVVTTNTLAPGNMAFVTDSNASDYEADLTFNIPTGADGLNATVDIGQTFTGVTGEPVMVTNSGTTQDAIFNFTIPSGADGADLTMTSITPNTDGSYTWVFSDGTTYDTEDLTGEEGEQGVSVNHIELTSDDPAGVSGNLDEYTMYGDVAEEINLGIFNVYNGVDGAGA
ncbi:MAG: hypothetical protein DRP93_02435, partial [Candidatus Neomarinimicrobiota bacterium]